MLKQTVITSPYSINWLGLVTETEIAYCALRPESFHIIQANFHVWKSHYVQVYSDFTPSDETPEWKLTL